MTTCPGISCTSQNSLLVGQERLCQPQDQQWDVYVFWYSCQRHV